ncbi:MAG: gliding motility-associated C-terminal domain-containing protein [Saprospiraceae bacterium]|nr:gliding motility-associated C-terminal domain-containing protein [Saprospiraceae bacterium]
MKSTSSIEVSDNIEKIVVVTDVNGCTATASKILIISPLPDAGPDQSFDCYKDVSVSLLASGNGRWTAATSNPTSVLIVNPLSPISEVRGFVRSGVYTFIWNDGFCEDMVIVTIGNNCPCEDVLNEIYEPSETVFCDVVTEMTLNGNQPASGNGSFFWEYSFNGGGFIPAPGINNLVAYQAQNLNPGTHSFRRFYLFDNENGTVCIDSSNMISVTVIPPVNAEFDVDINPNPVCAGDTVYVSINAMAAGTYEWNVISGNADIQTYPDRAIIIPQSEGKIVFTVTQTTEFCNFVSQPKPFEFTVNPRPRVALGRDTIICDQDQGFELSIDGDYVDITWDNGSKENSIFVEESGVYKVSVTDENGCTGYDEITIKDFCCKVYYPNIISFSSSNYVNRQFQIKESGCVISSELWIYDRWGNLVYKSDDGLAPWDGIFKGDLVEQGVYAFIFKFKALDENDEEFDEKISGDITILH